MVVRKQIIATIGLLLSLLCFTSPGAVADEEDDYLKQLSEEINRPEYLDQINVELKKLEKLENDGELTMTISNMVVLEGQLVKYAPSAYNFFVELSFVKKKHVYNFMKKEGMHLSVALKEILKIANEQ